MRAFLCLTLLALTAGCATSTGEPVMRLRPPDTDFSGEARAGYTGNFDVLLALTDYDDLGSVEFKNTESIGFRISARPSSWYLAPEVGYNYTDETESGIKLQASEAYAGGRLAARFTEIPVELYVNGGFSYLDAEAVNDDTSEGWYAGGGVYFYLGGREARYGERGGPNQGLALGLGYRMVDHDWDLDEWSEFFVNIGFAW